MNLLVREDDVDNLMRILLIQGMKGIKVSKLKKITGWSVNEIFELIGLATVKWEAEFNIKVIKDKVYAEILLFKEGGDYLAQKQILPTIPDSLLSTLSYLLNLEKRGLDTSLKTLQRERGKQTVLQDLRKLKNMGFVSERGRKWKTTDRLRNMIDEETFYENINSYLENKKESSK